MNIQQATAGYETWLAARLPLLRADLQAKHRRMAEAVFPFLRATFYRWAQLWPAVCPSPAAAPRVLAIGDLHIENFGTWRDCEGRLVWGVNDFDEVYPMAYTNDLVRLAVSAVLAIEEQVLSLSARDACDAILDGYTEGLAAGGCPFVLADLHPALHAMAVHRLRDPVAFWGKLDDLPTLRRGVPARVTALLRCALPEPGLTCRVVHRVAGLGSLGRQRFVALADWRGGRIAREAKALATSACLWPSKRSSPILYPAILERAVRVPDPFLEIRDGWLVRRLAPDCSRIELASLPDECDEVKLLYAMGFETANIHLGSPRALAAIRRDLRNRPRKWLRKSVKAMSDAVLADWRDWKKR
jgi:hypothetical protein